MAFQILIVEDEMDLRELLSLILKKSGYEIKVAANSQEALRLLQDYKPQLVISDLRMPGGSGIDLIRALSETDSARTPFLVMSGCDQDEIAILKSYPNFAGSLMKPVTSKELLKTVKVIESQSGDCLSARA